MRILVVFTSIYLYVSLWMLYVCGDAAEDKAKFLAKEKEGLMKCQKEGNYPESYIDDIYSRKGIPTDSKCFIKCAYLYIGWVGDDDKIIMDNIVEGVKKLYYMSEEYLKTVTGNYQECITNSPEEICEKCRYIQDCAMKKDAKAGIPVHSQKREGE